MRKPKATQILGVLVLAVSGLFVWEVGISPLIRWFGKRGNAADNASSESFAPIDWFITLGSLGLLAFGGVMIYCGIGLVKNRPLPPWTGAEDFPEEERWRGQIVVDPIVTYVRFTLAIFAAFGAFWVAAQFENRIPAGDPESSKVTLAVDLSLLVAAPIYVIVVRLLLRGRGYRGVEVRYLIGKTLVAVIAVLFWVTLSDFVQRRWRSGGDLAASYEVAGGRFFLEMAFVFGPIVVAVLLYRITLHLMRYQQIDVDLRRAGLPSSAELSAVTKSNTSK